MYRAAELKTEKEMVVGEMRGTPLVCGSGMRRPLWLA